MHQAVTSEAQSVRADVVVAVLVNVMSLTLLSLLFTLLIGVELSSSNLSDVMALS